jgi:hypothetical protein
LVRQSRANSVGIGVFFYIFPSLGSPGLRDTDRESLLKRIGKSGKQCSPAKTPRTGAVTEVPPKAGPGLEQRVEQPGASKRQPFACLGQTDVGRPLPQPQKLTILFCPQHPRHFPIFPQHAAMALTLRYGSRALGGALRVRYRFRLSLPRLASPQLRRHYRLNSI